MFERKSGRFLTLEIHTIGLAHEIKDSDFPRIRRKPCLRGEIDYKIDLQILAC